MNCHFDFLGRLMILASSLLFAYSMHLTIDAPHELKGNFFSGDLPFFLVYLCLLAMLAIDVAELFGAHSLCCITAKSSFFFLAMLIVALYSGSFTPLFDNLFSIVYVIRDFNRGSLPGEYMVYACASFILGAAMLADSLLDFFANIISLFVIPLMLLDLIGIVGVGWNIFLLLLSIFLGGSSQFMGNIIKAGLISAVTTGLLLLLVYVKEEFRRYRR